MKLIKKIAAIMFAFIMVFSLSTNAKANTGSQTTSDQTGSITITNVKKGETYNVYKVLTLDSYDKASNLYSYLPANDAWKAYFSGEGNSYMHLNANGYVETSYTDDTAQVLAQQLITKAKEIAESDSTIKTTASVTDDNGTLTISGLSLGYYVIDSTVGTLCALTTNDPNATFEEKHDEPTISKEITDNSGSDRTNETVKIGDIITYDINIDVKKGVKSYVLYDKLDKGLKYYDYPGTTKFGVDVHYTNGTIKHADPNNDYRLVLDTDTKGFTKGFTLTFTDDFIQLVEGKQITVEYYATVTKDADVDTAIKNTAYLKYGAAHETTHVSTSVFTYQIPVYKFTGESRHEQPLPGATFKLYKDTKDDRNLLTFDEKNGDVYTYNPTTGVTDLVSGKSGYIRLNGLSAGTYILEETKAPNGYNKLENTIKIVVTKNGEAKKITKDGDVVEQIDVKNNSGTILPSTGGMGTTLIYLIGGALVLGSGFVLANKKRAKAK